MRCGGCVLVLANTWCLPFSMLSWGALEKWDPVTGPAPLWCLGEEGGSVRQLKIFSVFVQCGGHTPLFSYSRNERERTLHWCPLSHPSLLHSPYLLPLFMWQPYCSALMRGHLKLLGWRGGGGTGHCDKFAFWHLPEQLLNQTRKLILSFCFLLQCDFPDSGWVEFKTLVTCWNSVLMEKLCDVQCKVFFFF